MKKIFLFLVMAITFATVSAQKGKAVDLGLSVKWADRNVGASSPSDCGDYFAWGETRTKNWFSYDNCKTIETSMLDISGNPKYDTATANWGDGWRMPNSEEFEELIEKCVWKWTSQGGQNGYRVTGPNGNSIFLPAAGLHYESERSDVGRCGYYWDSTTRESYFYSDGAYCLGFRSGYRSVGWYDRNYGRSVRPVYMEFENTSSNEQGNYMSLSDFYNDYVFGNKDFSSIAQTTCTPRLLQQLKDAYEYECESGDCYAMWLFRTGYQDGVSDVSKVTNVTDEGDGWFKVSYIDMGIEGATYIRFIPYKGYELMDEINVQREELNGHEWVDLGLSVRWATCNVGASSPSDYGYLLEWGALDESQDYAGVNFDIGRHPQYDVARAAWGIGWRLPTNQELEELKDKCTWDWATLGGHNGYHVTGPNGNSIFLPAAGWRYGSEHNDVGDYGVYWSSTPFESGSYYACCLYFGSGYRYVDWYSRNSGRSVRPVCD